MSRKLTRSHLLTDASRQITQTGEEGEGEDRPPHDATKRDTAEGSSQGGEPRRPTVRASSPSMNPFMRSARSEASHSSGFIDRLKDIPASESDQGHDYDIVRAALDDPSRQQTLQRIQERGFADYWDGASS